MVEKIINYIKLPDGETYKIGSSVESTWGTITGNITSQTDLQTALDSKQDVITDLETIRSGASKGATALQSIPAEYVTETELNAKGYLTLATLPVWDGGNQQ